MRFGKIIPGAFVCGLLALPARAELSDLTLAAPSFPVGDAELRLDGSASGALIAADQPGDGADASGTLKLTPLLKRDYDSGLSLGLTGTFTLADPLSRGRYTGPVEKFYGEARTGLGRIQVGMTDGAGYALRMPGPAADDGISLDDPQTTFFRDPRTHRAVTDMFALRTSVGASLNYAKLAYVSPALFGVQLALSFTPSEGKEGLPFVNAGPNVPGRQVDIWESALRYSGDFGPVSLSAYAAIAESRAEHKLPGQVGVGDLGLGLRADYPVNDDITVSLGGNYRQSNAYAFDINRSYDGYDVSGATRALHVSAGVTDGAWSGSVEYGNGVAGSVAGLARLGLNGMGASVGYSLNPGLSLSAGWQHLGYGRDRGAFYDGSRRLSLDAGFLHVTFHTTN